jgi:hypothetical protein
MSDVSPTDDGPAEDEKEPAEGSREQVEGALRAQQRTDADDGAGPGEGA